MKIKATMPLNLEGRNLNTGDEINIPVEEAKVLIRAGYAKAVIERAVIAPKNVEIRNVDIT